MIGIEVDVGANGLGLDDPRGELFIKVEVDWGVGLGIRVEGMSEGDDEGRPEGGGEFNVGLRVDDDGVRGDGT